MDQMTPLHTKLKELRELARTSPIKINAKVPALISALEKATEALDIYSMSAWTVVPETAMKPAQKALAEIAEMLEGK